MSKSEIDAAWDKYYEYEDARRKELNAVEDQSKRDEAAHIQKLKVHYDAYSKKIDSVRKKEQALYDKIYELEKQRPINQQLDASQQAYPNLPFMDARISPAAGTLQNSPFDDIEAFDKLTLAQKDAVLNAYDRKFKNSTLPYALRDYRNTSGTLQNPLMNAVFDAAAKLTGKEPAKKVFDYYNDTFLKNLSLNPPGSSPSNPVDMTKMMDKSEMNLIQSIVDTVMSDVNLTKDIDRENAMNAAFEQLTKTILVPTGLGFDAQDTATPNTRNIIGQLDPSKFDGFHIQKNRKVVLRKSYDFGNKPGDDDFAAAGGVGGIGASLYARYKGTPDYAPRGGETPSMHLQVMFNPTRNKRNRSGERSQASSLASQASSAVGLRRNRRGRVVESTWSKLKKHR